MRVQLFKVALDSFAGKETASASVIKDNIFIFGNANSGYIVVSLKKDFCRITFGIGVTFSFKKQEDIDEAWGLLADAFESNDDVMQAMEDL